MWEEARQAEPRTRAPRRPQEHLLPRSYSRLGLGARPSAGGSEGLPQGHVWALESAAVLHSRVSGWDGIEPAVS